MPWTLFVSTEGAAAQVDRGGEGLTGATPRVGRVPGSMCRSKSTWLTASRSFIPCRFLPVGFYSFSITKFRHGGNKEYVPDRGFLGSSLGPFGIRAPNTGRHRKLFCRKAMLIFLSHQVTSDWVLWFCNAQMPTSLLEQSTDELLDPCRPGRAPFLPWCSDAPTFPGCSRRPIIELASTCATPKFCKGVKPGSPGPARPAGHQLPG